MAILAGFGSRGGVAIVTIGDREAALTARRSQRSDLGVLGELQAFDGSLALLRNVPNNVRDGVRLILQVTVGNVKEAGGREALAVPAARLAELICMMR